MFTGAKDTGKPTATTTPTPIAGDADGDGELSESEKQLLAKNAPRDYTLPDGTVVTVDPTQPLPATVAEAVKEAAGAEVLAAAVPTQGPEIYGRNLDVQAELESQAALTGKGIVAVYTINSADGVIWFAMRSGGSSIDVNGSADKTAFLADVNTWAAARNFEVIVFD